MANKRPPFLRVPGQGAGRSIPSQFLVGRSSSGRGPLEILKPVQLGIATFAQVNSLIQSLLSTVTATRTPGPRGYDGEDGRRGPPGIQGKDGATGADGKPAVGQRLVVQSRSSSFGVNGGAGGGPSSVLLASAPTKGNLLVAIVAQAQSNGVPAAGTGWTMDSFFTAGNANNPVYYAVYYKYVLAGDVASQQPQVQGLNYAGMTVWELSGVSGTWAIDKVNIQFNDNTAAPSTSFTDAGYSTSQGGDLVLAMIVGDNTVGYATPTIMVQVGSGTLTPDDHVGATGGLDGSSIVAGHYTIVTNAGTALKESTSSANSSHWGSIYVEMASIGAAGPTGSTGATGAAGGPGPRGLRGEEAETNYWRGRPPGPVNAAILDNPSGNNFLASPLQLTPAAGAAVMGIMGNGAVRMQAARSSSNATGPLIVGFKQRGTTAAPAAVVQNDIIVQFIGQANTNGSNAISVASINVTIIEPTPSATAAGGQLTFQATKLGANTLTEVLRIEADTGISVFGANPVIDQNRVLRRRVFTVATLPTGVTGGYAAVSDSTVVETGNFGATVVGGGTHYAGVHYDGANWVIG